MLSRKNKRTSALLAENFETQTLEHGMRINQFHGPAVNQIEVIGEF